MCCQLQRLFLILCLLDWLDQGALLEAEFAQQSQKTVLFSFKVSPTYSPSFNKTFCRAVSLEGAAKEKQQEQPK